MTTIGDKLFEHFTNLTLQNLPDNVGVLNPYVNDEVIEINKTFYNRYYNDSNPRILLFGINPGRFGAGITGISFTDPIALENSLGIPNSFDKKPELSATFIHQVIKAYGGPELFFSKFLITAVSPLGYVKDGTNINYYDLKSLEAATKDFTYRTISEQYEITGKLRTSVSIGQGKNLKCLSSINKDLNLFDSIEKLGHPRWVMQYKRKELDKHINSYIELLSNM